MQTTIWKIKEKIISHPTIKILEETENSITVKPEGEKSFPITVLFKENKYAVYFKGWNESFLTEEDALDVFAFGLSDDCRLKVISAKDIEYKWIVEFKEKSKWIVHSETNIGMFPFWQRKNIKYYQNNILKNSNITNKK